MAKISANTIKVLDFLKTNKDKKMTSQDVAAALDMSVSTVNGVFTSLSNKKLGFREEGTVKGAVDINFCKTLDAQRPDDLSDNAKAILHFLDSVGNDDVTIDDISEATGIEKRKAVGTFNSLCKKKLAERVPAKVEGDITVKYLILTDEGMAYEPETEDAE